ncbi:YeeE/YedE family protein [Henriciella aquimarina]|uniref:YeeE/YedE family protein n=1 Tax=Henriciella aquimarina TaxID=545261 RepID=UPI000A000868|nr:YeeE/YedE family protein [Henriciella aquimarina]
MENLTPVSATLGGALIGLSAVMLMGLKGRIAGISGVFSGAVFAEPGDRGWRAAFVLGLVLAPVIYLALGGPAIAFELEANWPLVIVGGLLVGFGTRLGSGCTSGHGVCGLSRLSSRSMVSVALFMLAGMATASLIKPVFGG